MNIILKEEKNGDVKYLYITRYTLKKISVVKKGKRKIISDLYYTCISAMEAHIVVNLKFTYYIISAMEAHIIVN